MPTASRPLLVNAICLYVAAFLATIITHEVAHAVVSAGLGGRPILYNTYVTNTNKNLSGLAQGLVAAAGPLWSLVQGMGLLGWARRSQARGLGGLLGLFASVFGIINFFGYLMIAPLVPGGDTGQLVALLHVPAWGQWAGAVAAALVLLWVIAGTGPLFRRLVPAEALPALAAMRSLLLWPWLVGSAVLVALVLPVPYPSIVANLVMSPMVLGRAFRTGMQAAAGPAGDSGLLHWQWWPVLAALFGAVGFWLLGQGVAL
ncbi:hypothetical protein E4631_08220 [Hymenobacter sp. UV11]|uniref:hypothetical protein n=1 Tax=Hymenobacter sp. UV11 TaxID=1849735 RepID=UPI001060E9B3|nr:hypothetical protein [Hymenobacter sp. UV11]TDN36233.1 hypothetical protein A8B98_09925 [Hymenobacter sp. UV11]TFZ66938.1 hypothetical protein E4631_08220 [Hymenobacter sp. UV11]